MSPMFDVVSKRNRDVCLLFEGILEDKSISFRWESYDSLNHNNRADIQFQSFGNFWKSLLISVTRRIDNCQCTFGVICEHFQWLCENDS